MRLSLSLFLCIAVVALGFATLDAEARSGKQHKKCLVHLYRSEASDKIGRFSKSDKSDKSGKSGKSGNPTVPPEPPNQPPVAKNGTGRFPATGTTGVPAPGLLAGATDPDGDPLVVVAHDEFSALGATIFVGLDGSFGYRPSSSAVIQALQPGETLTDTFSFTISDGEGGTDTGTVTIVVFR